MSYLACELHCHTVHSDGAFFPKELQQAAVQNGLSLIALTDHNTYSGVSETDSRILPVIRGIEWTTYFGHMLVLGAERFVDWRDALPDNIDEKIKAVRDTGALVGVAHPFQLGSPMCTGGRWEFNVQDWSQVNYIEIWHEAFYPGSYENERAFAFWTELLDRGYHLAATYGRDWHRPSNTGHFCCTYLNINGEVNQQNALSAIKSGRTVVSSGARFFFTAKQGGKIYHIGDTLCTGEAELDFYVDIYARSRFNAARITHTKIRWVTNGGKILYEFPVTASKLNVPLAPNQWYRAELWGTFDGEEIMLAVTSPIYIRKSELRFAQ